MSNLVEIAYNKQIQKIKASGVKMVDNSTRQYRLNNCKNIQINENKALTCALELTHLQTGNLKIKIDYNQLGKVQNEIMNMGYFIKDTIYEDNVEIIVYSRVNEKEAIIERINDITSATAQITLGEEFYLSEKDGQVIL